MSFTLTRLFRSLSHGRKQCGYSELGVHVIWTPYVAVVTSKVSSTLTQLRYNLNNWMNENLHDLLCYFPRPCLSACYLNISNLAEPSLICLFFLLFQSFIDHALIVRLWRFFSRNVGSMSSCHPSSMYFSNRGRAVAQIVLNYASGYSSCALNVMYFTINIEPYGWIMQYTNHWEDICEVIFSN